jgi:predicted metal-dependent HD superfamily phosphohydrolase
MTSIDYLKNSWFNLWQDLSLKNCQLRDEVFTDLINTYSHPARQYHNLEHIKEIFSLLEQVADIVQNVQVLKLSAWFHDYVYNPQAKDNEELSAIYAKNILNQLNIDSEIVYSTTQIIRSTNNHQPRLTSIDNLIFLDLDLAILGSTPERYLQYNQAIRKEYQHLSDRDYYQGRTKVLTKFVTRPRIYYTDYFYRRFEAIARKNMQTEINYLTKI